MKIIDLLNKIANGKQPKHIRVYDEDWYWNDYDGYVTKWSLSTTPDAQHYLFSQYRLDFMLNKEVEIIEEEPRDIEICGSFFTKSEYNKLVRTEEEKKIEKINDILRVDDLEPPYDCNLEKIWIQTIKNHNKINELIDKVNNMENNK